MSNIKQKSITFNMVLNMVKGMMSIIFPLITFPYISRVLGVEGIGKFNFASSVVNYFILLAGLGISTYGIRSGAALREDKNKFADFANQIFTINFLATLISYLLLGLLLFSVNNFRNYLIIIVVLSLQIVFKTIGVDWIFSVFEDYVYTTVISVFFQFVSLVLMFVLVHSSDDILWYALIMVVSTAGSGIISFFYARKYTKIKLILNPQVKKHIKPILLFFATNITVMVYVNSDMTILGLISNDYTVGIYSVSVKIYTLVKTLLASAIVVSIPRMSALWNQNDYKKFENLGIEIYEIFLTLIMPVIVGLIVARKYIIGIISGTEFLDAQWSLIFLSVALFFCLGAGFWSQGVMIPQKGEKKVFVITVVSAVINICLNLLLIPVFQEKAAAITTLLSEMIVFIYCRYIGSKSIKATRLKSTLIKVLAGCVPMFFIAIGVEKYVTNSIFAFVLLVIACFSEYLVVELILKNTVLVKYKWAILNKLLSH